MDPRVRIHTKTLLCIPVGLCWDAGLYANVDERTETYGGFFALGKAGQLLPLPRFPKGPAHKENRRRYTLYKENRRGYRYTRHKEKK
jgi:hypothetical protein